MILDEIINKLQTDSSDINEHIPVLIEYGSKCNHITEMGVRGIVSTWAFIKSNPKTLISYDILPPKHFGGDLDRVYEISKELGIDFQFKLEDVLKIEIAPTDLLFLDTWHVYDQVKKELELHSSKVKKYIIFHDTTTYGRIGENSDMVGIWPAIEEFLGRNSKDWKINLKLENNNGLTILEKL